jgi:hypothetical protein
VGVKRRDLGSQSVWTLEKTCIFSSPMLGTFDLLPAPVMADEQKFSKLSTTVQPIDGESNLPWLSAHTMHTGNTVLTRLAC